MRGEPPQESDNGSPLKGVRDGTISHDSEGVAAPSVSLYGSFLSSPSGDVGLEGDAVAQHCNE